MKWFFICDCTKYDFTKFGELRLFVEDLFEFIGSTITEYSVEFENLKISKQYQYTENKKTKFDNLYVDDLWTSYFYSWPKKSQNACDIQCEFSVHNTTNHCFLTLTYTDQNGIANIINSKEQFVEFFSHHFDIDYFCADRLSNKKRPEWFVMGTLDESNRTPVENKVAYSIQLSKLAHHKLPFLFLYNITADLNNSDKNTIKIGDQKYSEFYFPELKNEEFDDYFKNQAWLKCFEFLKNSEILIFGKNKDI